MMIRNKILILLAFILFSACNNIVDSEKPVISVSLLPQKFFAEKIAGDKFEIMVLVPGGSSPETFEPSPAQIRSLINSDIYFLIGHMDFEQTLVRNIQAQNRNLRFINTAEDVDLIAAEIVEHGDHSHAYGVDPHIWLSVPEAKSQIKIMLDAITELDPDNTDYYLANYNRFVAEMDSLHDELSNLFDGMEGKSFLAFHPAFGYFARDYGLNQFSVEHEGKSPTAANMREIIDLAKREGIEDILIQIEFERDNAAAIARELGGSVVEINPLEENWLENMKLLGTQLFEVLN